ncbi:unnamed protein product [Vicia faba]|uniref:Reverse transcriptase domain-containing protein n=1 Tax=Vicia faba TaxID=3906 RepID=A0AAV0YY00_VICFA|nr:unnamed protein product [Vicia faba]
MLKKEVSNNNIHGVKVVRHTPSISQLFFADDSLLFTIANTKETGCVMGVLADYQIAYGKVVNLDKSEASFSRNVPDESKYIIQNRMRVKTVANYVRYLGLLVVFGRSKKEVFSFVVDCVWKNLKGWKEKFLSLAGKEVLIKAVAQEILNYIMGCYKIPEELCNDIKSMIAKFYWGSKEGEREIHWLSWQE